MEIIEVVAWEKAEKSTKLAVMVEHLKTEVVDKFLEGYLSTLSQVWVLHPRADLLLCIPFKEVIDGQIVDLVLNDWDVTLIESPGAPLGLVVSSDMPIAELALGPIDS